MKTTSTKEHTAQVWSCGGGTQSCAIGALIVQGKLPKPDVAVIADTGYETGATWEFLDGTLRPALATVGVEVVRIAAREYGYYWNDLFAHGECFLPVYTGGHGEVGKLPTWCSGNWKRDAIKNWLSRERGIPPSRARMWIGFSRDEQRRVVRTMRSPKYKLGLIWFPLVEHGLTRQDCIALVEAIGWPTPPRSSCYMCPNHSDHEWRRLINERPEEFAKAVALEREIHLRDPDAWLHRSCIPLDQVDFSQPEDLFSRPCDSGMCFV